MRPQLATDHAIAALAGRQGGVVARRQLLALGLSNEAVKRRLRSGRLLLLHRGVYAPGHTVLGADGHRWAAVLTCGAAATLSHASAAEAWDIRSAAAATRHDVTVDRRLAPPPPRHPHPPPSHDPAGRGHDTARPPDHHARADAARPGRHENPRASDSPPPSTAPSCAHGWTSPTSTRCSSATQDAQELPPSLRCWRDTAARSTSAASSSASSARCIASRARSTTSSSKAASATSYGRSNASSSRPTPSRGTAPPTALNDDRERDTELTLAGWRSLRFTYEQVSHRPGWVRDALLAALGRGLSQAVQSAVGCFEGAIDRGPVHARRAPRFQLCQHRL